MSGWLSNEKVPARFWNKVEVGDKINCWLWLGYKNRDGYGRMTINRKVRNAHRVSWQMHNNVRIPKGKIIRHKCDNPSCVNPYHLEIGTHADNGRDKAIRKRVPTRMSDEAISQIKSSLGTCKVVADKLGCSAAQVCLVRNGKRNVKYG